MSTLSVETVVARCLLDAEFLHAMRADPVAALAPYELDEAARRDLHRLDVDRVGQFAGFITKVQHNYLWQQVPYTRALMKFHRIEIELFSAYHARHLELRAARATRSEKIAAFLDFVAEQAAPGRWRGLADVVRHERLQWEIEEAGPPAEVAAAGAAAEPTGDLVPVARGHLRVGRFELSPLEIVAQIASGAPAPETLVARPHCLVYWAPAPAGEVRVMEADDLTAALLGAVDGRLRVRDVVSRVAGEAVGAGTVRRVLPIFERAAADGLLALREPGRG